MRIIGIFVVIALFGLFAKGTKGLNETKKIVLNAKSESPVMSEEQVFKTANEAAQWVKSNGSVVAAHAKKTFEEKIKPGLEEGLKEVKSGMDSDR